MPHSLFSHTYTHKIIFLHSQTLTHKQILVCLSLYLKMFAIAVNNFVLGISLISFLLPKTLAKSALFHTAYTNIQTAFPTVPKCCLFNMRFVNSTVKTSSKTINKFDGSIHSNQPILSIHKLFSLQLMPL